MSGRKSLFDLFALPGQAFFLTLFPLIELWKQIQSTHISAVVEYWTSHHIDCNGRLVHLMVWAFCPRGNVSITGKLKSHWETKGVCILLIVLVCRCGSLWCWGWCWWRRHVSGVAGVYKDKEERGKEEMQWILLKRGSKFNHNYSTMQSLSFIPVPRHLVKWLKKSLQWTYLDVSCLHQNLQVNKKMISLKILGRMPPDNFCFFRKSVTFKWKRIDQKQMHS